MPKANTGTGLRRLCYTKATHVNAHTVYLRGSLDAIHFFTQERLRSLISKALHHDDTGVVDPVLDIPVCACFEGVNEILAGNGKLQANDQQ